MVALQRSKNNFPLLKIAIISSIVGQRLIQVVARKTVVASSNLIIRFIIIKALNALLLNNISD